MRAVVAALWLVACSLAAAAAPHTPAQAIAELRRSGALVDVEIAGDLDVSALRPAAGVDELRLDGVTLQGRLIVRRRGPAVGLRLNGGSIGAIDAVDGTWPAPLVLVGVAVRQYVALDRARFESKLSWHGVRVAGPASFVQAHFDGTAEFTQCRFEPVRPEGSPRFREAVFHGPVRFDRSVSAHDLVFDGARFDADSSFVELKVPGVASWRNVAFGGDAEFRLADIGRAEFGDERHLSAFQRLADLRRARFGSLRLDYTDLRGELLMAGTVIERDFLLRHSALRGPDADLRGLAVGGVLDLEGTVFERLRLHWSEVGAAIGRAAPAIETWNAIEAALATQGRARESLAVAALRSRAAAREALRAAGPAERPLLWAEDLLWGHLTGYGTRLDLALATLLVVVVLVALPVFATRRLELADPSITGRVRLSLNAAFGRPASVAGPGSTPPRWWAAWRWISRLLGLGAVGLVTLTLARVSPAMQGLVKALLG